MTDRPGYALTRIAAELRHLADRIDLHAAELDHADALKRSTPPPNDPNDEGPF